MGEKNLDRLSPDVRISAIVLDNGEVMWPFEQAHRAIDDLTDTGCKILGLDARNPTDDGPTEVALSDSSSMGLEDARADAHTAIDRAEGVTNWTRPHILVTWRT